MTDQELYSKVRKHLLTQGKPALAPPAKPGYRMYRFEGLSCAVGCLIPDDKYDPDFEHKSADWKRIADAAGLAYDRVDDESERVSGGQIPLACSLQNVHDCFTAAFWPERLAAVAKQYNLVVEA